MLLFSAISVVSPFTCILTELRPVKDLRLGIRNTNTENMSPKVVTSFCILLCILSVRHCSATENQENVEEMEQKEEKLDDKKLEYAKGSLCGYCEYCAFCKLCDEQCPCESSPTKPNCHMCKYCKFCYLCKVCDSICQPGGIIDTVTAAVVNAIPTVNRDEVDKDIEGAKSWIDAKRDEL